MHSRKTAPVFIFLFYSCLFSSLSSLLSVLHEYLSVCSIFLWLVCLIKVSLVNGPMRPPV